MKLFLIAAAILASSASFAEDAPKIDPAKSITVTLTVQDWQAVVSSVGDSARISARDAGRINQAIVSQVQAQIAPRPKK